MKIDKELLQDITTIYDKLGVEVAVSAGVKNSRRRTRLSKLMRIVSKARHEMVMIELESTEEK